MRTVCGWYAEIIIMRPWVAVNCIHEFARPENYGKIVSYNLDQDLISENYVIKRIINYTAIPNENLSDDFLKDIKSSVPEIVYIYSENSAKTFFTLIKKYNLDNIWMETNLMCMGEKASSALNDIKWKKIFLFNPGEEEFLLYKI